MHSVRRRLVSFGLAVTAALATLGSARSAAAFCRATTCNPAKQTCTHDGAGCSADGLPVFWAGSCITISVQADGAPHAGVDFDAAQASLQRAVEAWTQVECPGGGHPSLHVELNGPVTCSEAEYNREHKNANIIIFRDQMWPYAGISQDTLGYTNLNFNPDTGELYDADIELNAVDEPLAVGRKPTASEVDLDSVMTHELGHLLGLDHSRDVAATMVGGYQNGSIELRTPAADDIAGICALYPPQRQASDSSCEPRHGFSEQCAADQTEDIVPPGAAGAGGDDSNDTSSGCSFTLAVAPLDGAAQLAALGAALLLSKRAARRRRRWL